MAEEWVTKTQATLGTLVKKPKLSDNLLKKPPFRFIHDVVSETTRCTGFATGLFDESESDPRLIKLKEDKIGYLNKLVDCVGFATGTPVAVNPKKIVAGHEPENTNALFQALYAAATEHIEQTEEAVRRVRAGEKPSGAAPPPKPKRPQSSAKAKRQDPPPPPADGPPPEKPPAPRQAEADAFPAAPTESTKAAAGDEKPRRKSRKPEGEQPPPPKPPAPAPAPAPPHPATRDDLPARPQTARRAPPKVKSNEVPVEREPQRPPSGKQASADGGGGSGFDSANAPTVIGEGDASDDDDMIIEQAPTAGATSGPKGADSEPHGGLVGDLMAAKEKFEDASKPAETTGADQTSGGGIIIKRKLAGGRDGKDSYKTELTALRDSIQTLCQNTNPLGKTMDYIQEDLENMHKELEHWKSERRRRAVEYEELDKSAEDALGPLSDAHAKAKEGVVEQQSKIIAIKAQIMSNDQQIQNMLRMVVSSAGN